VVVFATRKGYHLFILGDCVIPELFAFESRSLELAAPVSHTACVLTGGKRGEMSVLRIFLFLIGLMVLLLLPAAFLPN